MCEVDVEVVDNLQVVDEVDVEVVDDLQVVDGVLQAKMPCNLPKKTTGRNVRKPEGSARFDPQSAEWREIWEDQETERREKEEKRIELERKRADREEMKRKKEREKQEREDRKKDKQDKTNGKRKTTEQN